MKTCFARVRSRVDAIDGIHLRKISLSAYFKAILALFRVQRTDSMRDSMQVIDRTSFTEFGGELGDQQTPTLERTDVNLGPFTADFIAMYTPGFSDMIRH